MKKAYAITILVLAIHLNAISSVGFIKENEIIPDSSKIFSYPLIIQDSPSRLFTMRQFNQNFLSSYRFLNKEFNKLAPNKLNRILQFGMELFLLPLTHEEGHRSILISKGIGSISRPYINSKGAAYVDGVKDIDLINLRNNDLPDYIRLHTAGLESDYMLSNRIEEAVTFGFDNKENLLTGYLFRKFGMISYYSLSMFPFLSPKLKEESNELDRDIVGHDVYGAVKNLHRPNIAFYRYTDYEDLTTDEVRFVKRVGYRALLNIVSPLLFKQLRVIKKENMQMSVGAGYSMCPFGDFIDENFWIKYQNKYNIHTYFRQFQNKNNWFLGGGLRLVDYQIAARLKTSLSGHFWSQPQNLDFSTSESEFGGSGDLLLKYIILKIKKSNSLSFDLGMNYKTFGFLPEEVMLEETLGLRFGVTINLH